MLALGQPCAAPALMQAAWLAALCDERQLGAQHVPPSHVNPHVPAPREVGIP